MKKAFLFISLPLLFSACVMYDSLPEPELPLEYVEFDSARYVPAGSNTIVINFKNPFPYYGVYPFYNGEKEFDMSYYIKGNDIGIRKSTFEHDKITIELFGFSRPASLEFDTMTPWYFYVRKSGSWNYIVEAKAFIITQAISVTD